MKKPNSKVTNSLIKAKQWHEEIGKLRTILLSCGLKEEVKWGKPAYTFQKHPIVVIQGFKKYIALLFLKGVLIDDNKGILVKTGENTRVGRQIRFTNADEILKMKTAITSYVRKAVAAEKAGLKVDLKDNVEPAIPEEFQEKLNKDRALKTAFDALTPGRQRAYIFFFPRLSRPKPAKQE